MEKSALRQRLIGAAVLIAAGVIFIPWLLDDEQARTRLSDSVIPAQPDLQIQVIEFNPSARGTLPAPRMPRELPPEVAEVKAPPPEPKVVEPIKAEAKPAAVEPKPVVAAKPVMPLLTDSSEVKGWVVQVASFTEGRVERASMLLDALKKKGYRAVAEKVEVKGTTYYRISVIGLANESIATRASKAIDEAFKAERIESQVKQR
ncbi:MAG: SPOR domain-containing protein [Gammaproteobacteria bacterium]|jgi:DedD protein